MGTARDSVGQREKLRFPIRFPLTRPRALFKAPPLTGPTLRSKVALPLITAGCHVHKPNHQSHDSLGKTMATNVSLVVLTHTPSKFVLATVPKAPGFWQKVRGKPLADHSLAPIESWDFDRDTGTLVVTSVTDLGAPPESLEIPLAALTERGSVGSVPTSCVPGGAWSLQAGCRLRRRGNRQ
jgi:hypothetical protein